MPDVIVPITPITTTQYERRCSHTVGTNNLDLPMPANPTLEQLATKFGLVLTVWNEPLDADKKSTGPRVRVPDKRLPMLEVLQRNFTAVGVTLPGAAILALYNEIIDAYKGDVPPT